MTATWLTTGAIMIVGLTAAAAVLPVPLSRLRASRGSAQESSNLRASKYGGPQGQRRPGRRGPERGTGRVEGPGQAPSSGKAKGSGKTNDPNAKQQTNGKGREGGGGGQGRSKSGEAKGKPASSQNGQQGKKGAPQEQVGEKGQGPQPGRRSGQGQGRGKAARASRATRRAREQDGEKSAEENPDQGDSSSQAPKLPSLPGHGLVADSDHGRGDRDRDLRPVPLRPGPARCPPRIARLAAGGVRVRPEEGAGEGRRERGAPEPPPRPFASYGNPFDTGLDHQLTPDDLVVYSFEALEAWAYEHELARSPHETPMEFVRPGRPGAGRPRPGRHAAGRLLLRDRLRPARLPLGGPAAAAAVLAGIEGSGGAVLAEQATAP